MKKIILLATLALLSASAVSAQNYKWAAGVRIGGEMSGLTVKHKFSAANAIEGILAFPWDNGFLVTALYERHMPVISDGFNFYYGGGGQLGSWSNDFSIGVAGVVGLEYQIPRIPLLLSLDYKPVLNIASDTRFYLADIGLGIKVSF